MCITMCGKNMEKHQEVGKRGHTLDMNEYMNVYHNESYETWKGL